MSRRSCRREECSTDSIIGGFRVDAENTENELVGIDHYRVFEKEIPEEYHVAAVAVGFNTDGVVTWDDSFRVE